MGLKAKSLCREMLVVELNQPIYATAKAVKPWRKRGTSVTIESVTIENENKISFLLVLAGGHALCDNGRP
jgi:hypothetical protein